MADNVIAPSQHRPMEWRPAPDYFINITLCGVHVYAFGSIDPHRAGCDPAQCFEMVENPHQQRNEEPHTQQGGNQHTFAMSMRDDGIVDVATKNKERSCIKSIGLCE